MPVETSKATDNSEYAFVNGLHDCTRHTLQEFGWLIGDLGPGQQEVLRTQLYDAVRGVMLPHQRGSVADG